jgi:YfiR/HmsC-like
MRTGPKSIAILAVVCAGLALCPHASAAAEMSEYKVKALFLYNFVKFVEWPQDQLRNPQAPLTICVLGPNPFKDELEQTIRDKAVDGRPIATRQIRETKEAVGCQILFIGANQPRRPRTLLGELGGTGILTVGEVDGFASDGGVINFKIKDGMVRLEINVKAAEREGLHISSKLLSLADIVKERQ